MEPQVIEVNAFVASTIGFLVFLIGAQLTRRIEVLREFNIPEPVSGGLFAAGITMGVFLVFDTQITFDLAARDYFLLLFFSAIGLNARLADLRTGGVPFLILLALTLLMILVQCGVGIATALGFGFPAKLGVLLGSASLIGGHGTTIAWTPEVLAQTGVEAAGELGISVATLGLVTAALVGGPVARFLITRNSLTPDRPDEDHTLGLPFDEEHETPVTSLDMIRAMFWLHVTIIFGFAAGEGIEAAGLQLPDFVPCLLMGIVLGNLVPVIAPRLPRFTRTPALSLISDFALGTFLALSLMALQLWTLAGLGSLIAVTIAAQTLVAVGFVLLILFRAMGGGYRAAVLASGFAGFSLGATPTAIANMNAVTKRYGPSPIAFVILPLVSAFFVDLANAAVIQAILDV